MCFGVKRVQVECADVLVLNKMDTLDEKNQGLLTEVRRRLLHI